MTRRTPTGKYVDKGTWPTVIEAAKLNPRTKLLAENYEKWGHPGCLNAIMENGDDRVWLAYHQTGARVTGED